MLLMKRLTAYYIHRRRSHLLTLVIEAKPIQPATSIYQILWKNINKFCKHILKNRLECVQNIKCKYEDMRNAEKILEGKISSKIKTHVLNNPNNCRLNHQNKILVNIPNNYLLTHQNKWLLNNPIFVYSIIKICGCSIIQIISCSIIKNIKENIMKSTKFLNIYVKFRNCVFFHRIKMVA